ncbi:formylmethanofuran dehydrogenase subunit E family protein [Geoalkalibacter sp.]|uniref:formylmethanofuran dehydrogenase subunit E family protein n=1 Tax=Geoalkalibacter sp. TaxID=3041440 RepID=UPI00272E2DA0|nr:formylmethanofuran dehydrogenase subunit E family protein [Geoalkalibacter sp.]
MQPLPPAQLYDAIRSRHGHYCPMSTLGGRMGFAGRRRLGDGPLRGEYLLRTCAVEGIAVATGCEEPAGTLRVRDAGRHVLLLRCASGAGFEIALRPATLELAWRYRHLDEALESERAALAPAELARRTRDKDAFLDGLLARLRALPEDELLDIRPLAADST